MASGFDLLPAIDLRAGRVVRLEQGDFSRETAFSDDPLAVAEMFASQGARWLHVVDLDGARTGERANDDVVRAIAAAVGGRLAVEVAGGLRSAHAVDAVLEAGATRAVVGTAALEDPPFVAHLIKSFGAERIVVALDVRDGRAVGRGWESTTPGPLVDEALAVLTSSGVRTFEVTAIDRDGLLGGPDLALYERLVSMSRGSIIASGGITSIADVGAVRALGCTGAIIGRALYEGRVSLEAAREAASG